MRNSGLEILGEKEQVVRKVRPAIAELFEEGTLFVGRIPGGSRRPAEG